METVTRRPVGLWVGADERLLGLAWEESARIKSLMEANFVPISSLTRLCKLER